MLRFISACSLLSSVASVTVVGSTNSSRGSRKSGSYTAVVSGVSGKAEMCLASVSGRVRLEPCVDAILAGDGREIWSFASGGQLAHVATKRCVGFGGASEPGVPLVETACDGAPRWEITPEAQLKAGALCLSQSGAAAGVENVALHAAVSASSTFDAFSHGAWAAVDGNDATYWASQAGEAKEVELVIDFGASREVDTVDIAWEFAASSFSVFLGDAIGRWEEVFGTTVNILDHTHIDVRGHESRKMKIVMRTAIDASRSMFGIRSVSASANRLRSVLEDCVAAGKSTDARDKYFLASVGGYDVSPHEALSSALPGVNAAEASLSSSVAALAAVGPQIAACKGQAPPSLFAPDRDQRAADDLLSRARQLIISARQALKA